MVKARLLQAVCAVTLLAAAPAFAQQTITQPADTGPGNSVKTPVAHDTPTSVPAAPAEKMGRPMHHSASGSHAMMHAKNDVSQNSAVDQLNNQSYQAAQSGQTFSASDTSSVGATRSGGSGGMNGTSMSPATAASGSGGGAGGSGAK